MTNDELKDLVAIFNAQDAAKELRSAKITVNGQECICYETGEIERTHGRWGTSIRCFGYENAKYMRILLGGRSYSPHRVIYEAFHGKIPDGMQIDHIDGDGKNNSLDNLRSATARENNIAHRSKRDGVTSKYRGVCLPSGSKKWRVGVKELGYIRHIGLFDTELEAANAYDAAARKAGFFKEALNFPDAS